MLELMIAPLAVCIILVGIHVYFGMHVIEREVIFVDLALAQVSALGAIIGLIFDLELNSVASYFFSLMISWLAAGIFALSRFRIKKYSQEAMIGIVYAVSSALAILVLDKIPSEAEHIKHMLVGNILFVKWSEIVQIAVIYSLVALFHFSFRNKFFLVSTNPDQALAQNISIKLWDFLFYASFGIVITSSVKIAGVLLVFSYLIIPAFCVMLFWEALKTRLLLGWLIGILSSLAGLYLSTSLDFPTGPAVICSLGGVLVIMLLSQKALLRKKIRNSLQNY